MIKVGVGALIIKNGEILLGLRINSHGENCWAPPGGHLEFGETPENCIIREVKEETSLDIKDIISGPWSNDLFQFENKHYITLHMIVRYTDGEIKLCEPKKCKGWEWFDIDKLPTPLFLPLANMMSRYGNLKNLLLEYL
ncbi:MAG: nucleotide triphosphate diphosphatase NUDT15 [Alphaproteobacteria bacterium]